MRGHTTRIVSIVLGALLLGVTALVLGTASARSDVPGTYTVHNLNSDIPVLTTKQDSDLQNGWGITEPTSGPWWVSDNGTDKSTLYAADGTKQGLVVDIVNGAPTGTVFNDVNVNGSSAFVVSANGHSGPAAFLFASESGTISGWNRTVDATQSVVGTTTKGAVYKGLALATAASGPQLYATDFVGGRVDVFNSSFGPGVASGHFIDPHLPPGYAPFGIAAVNGMLVVTFAKQKPGSADEQHHQGFGVVDAFNTDGNLISRIATHGQLNAPWGIARAPAGFGPFSGDLLIGNFGDGQINAYAQQPDGSWARAGGLRDSSGRQISIDGLWGIGFGNGGTAGPTTTLYFAAGPNDENSGLFGSITAN
jgi:uncharacterized protein (TIGR03118 family)